MARETIGRMEHGRAGRRDVILGLADALDVAPSELTGITDLDALMGFEYRMCKGAELDDLRTALSPFEERHIFTCAVGCVGPRERASGTTPARMSVRSRSHVHTGTTCDARSCGRCLGVARVREECWPS